MCQIDENSLLVQAKYMFLEFPFKIFLGGLLLHWPTLLLGRVSNNINVAYVSRVSS